MQLDLFRKARRPARRNPRTLTVIDAGHVGGDSRHGAVSMECGVCGHRTGWLKSRGVEAERAGRVCPICKGDPDNVKPSDASGKEATAS
ncbi:hypothetical protein [Azospirillum picis]|uniref:Uncharacterized protein n=1 Tax=Azospirillum picis TaxID=488438 RepID=A0ABU0MNS0_9PROT|nr:hypothetical protein [Azospirillum picis]MBP2301288.1 hypothetical protein [Azospirillum picis]MDQ0535119.1 hypothetical protein [Azospirillum picis]